MRKNLDNQLGSLGNCACPRCLACNVRETRFALWSPLVHKRRMLSRWICRCAEDAVISNVTLHCARKCWHCINEFYCLLLLLLCTTRLSVNIFSGPRVAKMVCSFQTRTVSGLLRIGLKLTSYFPISRRFFEFYCGGIRTVVMMGQIIVYYLISENILRNFLSAWGSHVQQQQSPPPGAICQFLAYYAWPRTYPPRSWERNPWRQHVHRATRRRSQAIDMAWRHVDFTKKTNLAASNMLRA